LKRLFERMMNDLGFFSLQQKRAPAPARFLSRSLSQPSPSRSPDFPEASMNWLAISFLSSIGKKLMMAVTGLCFLLFLCVHLGGNLTLFGGGGLFNAYATHLHALGPLVTAAEWGLLILALIHILTGVTLFFANLRARPQRYRVNHWAGGRTVGSATMPYTGILILAFVVFHLVNFHFADRTGTTLYAIVAEAFSSPLYVTLYVIAMILVAFHVSHGFWSLFQTLGLNHPKYMPAVERIGLLLSLLFGIGFGAIPVFILLFAQGG
jgi:succinate dehydrogenase / fumarate reductase cytochrome b subunit